MMRLKEAHIYGIWLRIFAIALTILTLRLFVWAQELDNPALFLRRTSSTGGLIIDAKNYALQTMPKNNLLKLSK